MLNNAAPAIVTLMTSLAMCSRCAYACSSACSLSYIYHCSISPVSSSLILPPLLCLPSSFCHSCEHLYHLPFSLLLISCLFSSCLSISSSVSYHHPSQSLIPANLIYYSSLSLFISRLRLFLQLYMSLCLIPPPSRLPYILPSSYLLLLVSQHLLIYCHSLLLSYLAMSAITKQLYLCHRAACGITAANATS